jgi:hypothetical protein
MKKASRKRKALAIFVNPEEFESPTFPNAFGMHHPVMPPHKKSPQRYCGLILFHFAVNPEEFESPTFPNVFGMHHPVMPP